MQVLVNALRSARADAIAKRFVLASVLRLLPSGYFIC
jgi:hypothetical protein